MHAHECEICAAEEGAMVCYSHYLHLEHHLACEEAKDEEIAELKKELSELRDKLAQYQEGGSGETGTELTLDDLGHDLHVALEAAVREGWTDLDSFIDTKDPVLWVDGAHSIMLGSTGLGGRLAKTEDLQELLERWSDRELERLSNPTALDELHTEIVEMFRGE